MLQAQIFIDKDELKGSLHLYEFILQFLIKHKIKGATVFRGSIGYGHQQYLNRPTALFSFDETPMMIIFIDEDEKVKSTLTDLRQEIKSGFIVTSQVDKWQ
jgi:uncharacterized protein